MPAFDETFDSLSRIMRKHATGFSIKTDEPGTFYVELATASPKAKPSFFGVVQTKKSYVSYHLMPVYEDPSLLNGVSEALRSKSRASLASTSRRWTPLCSKSWIRLLVNAQRQPGAQPPAPNNSSKPTPLRGTA